MKDYHASTGMSETLLQKQQQSCRTICWVRVAVYLAHGSALIIARFDDPCDDLGGCRLAWTLFMQASGWG
jgi:hypothetical protein